VKRRDELIGLGEVEEANDLDLTWSSSGELTSEDPSCVNAGFVMITLLFVSIHERDNLCVLINILNILIHNRVFQIAFRTIRNINEEYALVRDWEREIHSVKVSY
jgi:hypothetical protein